MLSLYLSTLTTCNCIDWKTKKDIKDTKLKPSLISIIRVEIMIKIVVTYIVNLQMAWNYAIEI